MVYLACWLRFDFNIDLVLLRGTAWFAIGAAIGQLLIGAVVGPYSAGHRHGSFEEVTDIAKTVLVVGGGLFTAALLTYPVLVPRSVPIIAAALALLAMFSTRFAVRAAALRRTTRRGQERRVVLFGAGEAGRRLTRSLLRDESSTFLPVAILDDDKTKARLRFDGVRVRGTREDLEGVVRKFNATDVFIALPNADAALIRDISQRASVAGVRTKVLPRLSQILDGAPSAQDLRDVNLEDLLGRRPVEFDRTTVAEQLSGRTVLVTGAGGSIGAELCRQIARFGPSRLLLLDRDESALQATQLKLTGRALLEHDDLLLVDIRDAEALRRIFELERPEVVFHAAALKHLSLLERFALEAWQTNVLGSLNVLAAAAAVQVRTFVNISTDKAANPTSVLGLSKRLGERLTADFAARAHSGRYVSVRFGNVLGSRGSVVPTFLAQIAAGGPLTVTHPDVRRYFMLVPEACELVLQAAAVGTSGDVLVLDMGDQVRITEVAHTLISMSRRRDIDIVYTGLRPGEKLVEELYGTGEHPQPTAHALVSRVAVPQVDPELIRRASPQRHGSASIWMRQQMAAERQMANVDA
ncbi:nucleoside-diphosphate sugar epimerase/dehydratase [Segeticoccus rhizosphaerae]|uniref:nucleoside-diphosphate sugar epimerase/dehydratase n=1 Tax=Segeticoccus rhizosphaerae TaxID=1104777 RepID=UPI001EF154F8|nr:nucleoside-diphosphate sugar epimerase/dehydratase [Segeticoccus rhizosphaerae]